MKTYLYTFILSLLFVFYFDNTVDAQSINIGTIEGRISNAKNNEPIPFATIIIWETTIGTVSDLDGRFIITGIKPGYLQLKASSVGFEDFVTTRFLVTNAKNSYIEIALQEANIKLDAVVVKASPFRRQEESPVSLRRIGVAEIEKNPGGNRDISRVIQSFPGVASTPAYRNDVIVRGGGPSESKFYLDGVEIPNLNHFATQGASGGPVGIINVDFIREVNFYSGAFPANRGNALSSVLDFRQIDGNKEKPKFRATVGASDLALTLDGPLGDKTSYILSARRSYLQLLFAALELPFLPTYNDFQFKLRTRFNEKNELTVIGLGALDQNKLNLNANETADQRFILGYLPENDQWNYTFGLVYKHFRENGFDTWVLSRNMLNNVAYKHEQNDENLPKTLDYSSIESENKFRYERNSTVKNNIKVNYGINFEYAKYENSTYRKIILSETSQDLNYASFLDMFNYGLFGQVSNNYLGNRLILSAGLRFDGSSYSDEMTNPLKQFSPRFSASYVLSEKFIFNFNTGRYYQRPPYTALGFKDSSGEFVNRKNGISFIASDQLVAGLEFSPDDKSNFSIEGFYKHYRNYPFSLSDSVALATKGADFGTFGDEALVPVAEGRAYGLEIFGRTLDLKGANLILSYTLVWSEFKNTGLQSSEGEFIPTSWDNRHIFNITATRSFKRNWDFGFKWRFVGAAPYTPFDAEKSSIKEVWDATGIPSLDYTLFNSLRLKSFHQLDIRIDKQYFFKKWSLMLYVDIQNLYNFKAFEPDRLVRNSIVNPGTDDVVDDNGILKYDLVYLKSDGSGTILPTIGIMVEF